MSKRWSKLQSRLYNLLDPNAGFQIHCALYEMNSNDGYHTYKLPRYWVTIGKEIVFDYPKDFDTTRKYGHASYPWLTEISDISNLIEKYVQRSDKKIMDPFEEDVWRLTEIIRACDKRIGKQRLLELRANSKNEVICNIVDRRIGISLLDERLNLKADLMERDLSDIEIAIVKNIRYYPGDEKKTHECDYRPSPFKNLELEQLVYIREHEEFRNFLSWCLEKGKENVY